MSDDPNHSHSRLTLGLCTILHAFTHAYGAMLVPLYLLIVADLKLGGVKAASLVVTVYSLVYCLGSYASGVLADRFNRKTLLGVGLVGNAAAILAMGLTRRYDVLVALGVLGGLAGTLFHPAANALIPAHFPKTPGLAIGLLGMGSGLGFFAGPQYAGWRAQANGWHVARMADWQRPLVELGAAGLVCGVAFLLLASETPAWRRRRDAATAEDVKRGSSARVPLLAKANSPAVGGARRFPTVYDVPVGEPTIRSDDAPAPLDDYAPLSIDAEHALGPTLAWRVVLIAAVLGCRDFAGVAGLSLASIYMQKAHGLDARHAGFVVGTMMLLSVVVSPLAVWVTAGRRRLPSLAAVMIVGGCVAVTVPYVPLRWTLTVLCAFQTCQLSSYAVSDAAMLERVAPAVRGRVVGLFLTIAGTFSAIGPWVMGAWVDRLGPRAADPLGYTGPFALLGWMLMFAALASPLIARLGRPDQPQIDPLSEITPVTLGPAG